MIGSGENGEMRDLLGPISVAARCDRFAELASDHRNLRRDVGETTLLEFICVGSCEEVTDLRERHHIDGHRRRCCREPIPAVVELGGTEDLHDARKTLGDSIGRCHVLGGEVGERRGQWAHELRCRSDGRHALFDAQDPDPAPWTEIRLGPDKYLERLQRVDIRERRPSCSDSLHAFRRRWHPLPQIARVWVCWPSSYSARSVAAGVDTRGVAGMGVYREQVLPRVLDKAMNTKVEKEIRPRVCAGLHGKVVEIGFGSGLNTVHYPPEMTSVYAIEPSRREPCVSPSRRLQECPVPVERAGLTGERPRSAVRRVRRRPVDVDAVHDSRCRRRPQRDAEGAEARRRVPFRRARAFPRRRRLRAGRTVSIP